MYKSVKQLKINFPGKVSLNYFHLHLIYLTKALARMKLNIKFNQLCFSERRIQNSNKNTKIVNEMQFKLK